MISRKKNAPKLFSSALFFLFFLTFLLPINTYASNTVFNRSLKAGDVGDDVVQLQKILNSDSETQVAASGIGSSGFETSYFGNLTKQAVIKFQNKYPTDILVPAGLNAGNGFVGPLTIKKLNSLTVPMPTQIPQPVSISTPTPLSVQKTIVYSLSPHQIRPGGTITIHGNAIPKTGNTVTIAGVQIPNLTSDGNSITFNVPATVSLGNYPIVVSNNGITLGSIKNVTLRLIITNSPLAVPAITSVNPNTASDSDTITIHGSGFTQNNIISTPIGLIKNIASSDGTMLSFQVSQLSNIASAAIIKKQPGQTGSVGMQISIIVINEAGASNPNLGFVLK